MDLREQRRAERETILRKSVNVEVLMSDSDEQLARQARLVDNSTFAIPGQEEATDKRLEQAKKDYKRAKEFHDAEQEVLQDVLGNNNSYYSQEALMERLREYQDSVKESRDENWVQLSQVCSRLMGCLEKFVPDLADDLSREDWDYWDKITGKAKLIAPEALVPKTLPKDELAKITGDSMSDSASAMETNDVDGSADEMFMEDAPTGKTQEQMEAGRAEARRKEDEAFRERIRDCVFAQRAIGNLFPLFH